MGDVKEYVTTAPGLRNHGRILGAHRPTNAMEEQSAEESTPRSCDRSRDRDRHTLVGMRTEKRKEKIRPAKASN